MRQKEKTYSLTSSLDTRIAIAGGTQIFGYLKFWEHICDAFDIDMDAHLQKRLKSKDKKKKAQTKVQISKKGKETQGEKKYTKQNTSHEE